MRAKTEDKEKIERLTDRETRCQFVRCCDDFDCPKCWGSGGWHVLVFASCGHVVYEPNGHLLDEECHENFCQEREQVNQEFEREVA